MTFVIVWIICAFIGMGIGKGKGKGGAGFALGLFLGPIGIVIIALMKENTVEVEAMALSSGESRKCPFCAELVKREALICKHCGKELPPVPATFTPALDTIWNCSECKASNHIKFNVCQACGKARF